MNYLSVSNALIFITNLPLAVIFFLTSKGRRPNIILGYLCVAAVIWGFGSCMYSATVSRESAIFWWKIANVGSIFSTVIFYYFILSYLNIQRPILSAIVNAVTAFYLYLNFFAEEIFIGNLTLMFDRVYYIEWPVNKVTFYLVYYILYYFCLLFYSFWLLIKEYVGALGVRRLQMKYLILGMVVGFVGCHACFVPIFGLKTYPYLNILIAFYTIPIGYAIIKYQLMDIRLAITKAGIFIFVYTLVLGIPFGVGLKYLGKGLWLMPVSLMAVFATIGPFIYLYIQKRAEEAMLQEQRHYQMTLQQASLGMGQIKELKRLLRLVVHIITRTVSIEHTEVYLLHEDSKQYTLRASRGWLFKDKEQVSMINVNSPFAAYLKENKNAVICEEMKQYARDKAVKGFYEIEGMIDQLDAALVVPSFIDQKMIALLILGNKKAKKMYTQDDLAVFTILANQAGLAIENAQFYDRMKETHSQLIKAEKMATVGTMADGLSHQINNRLHAMGFIAGDVLDTIRLKKKEKSSKGLKEFFDEIEFAVGRIEDNVRRGGEIVEGLLKYTRKGSEGFEPIPFDKLLDSAIEMAGFKIKLNQLTISKNFGKDIPEINGNFTQLQEVFFNIIDNAYDAMMQRKEELKEEGYQPTLEFSVANKGVKVEVLIKDNGMGVKPENLEKLFTPFFTTKLSSKKGTGLGLYVIRQIIEENHRGRVRFTSEYKTGSQSSILLPMAVEKQLSGKK